MLGTLLTGGESVHHRNVVNDDNRPENLERWTRLQPRGIRISGAIEWARGILDLSCSDERNPPPTTLTANPERSWRWRESNPRPPVPQ